MAKKVAGFIKLQVPAGKANPSPPIGPALGQRGLNIMEFCKAFNAQTSGPNFEAGMLHPVVITAYQDRTFSFVIKHPPVPLLVKKAAKLEKGSKTPGNATVGKITQDQIRVIAEKKMPDMNAHTVEAAMTMVAGSARSIGIQVVE